MKIEPSYILKESEYKELNELSELITKLSKPILYEEIYYFLQLSETRCWYSDFNTGDCPPVYGYDTCVGRDIISALRKARQMRLELFHENI